MLCIVDLEAGRSLAEVNQMMACYINQTKLIKSDKSEDHFQRIRVSILRLLKYIRRLSERIGHHAYKYVLLYSW